MEIDTYFQGVLLSVSNDFQIFKNCLSNYSQCPSKILPPISKNMPEYGFSLTFIFPHKDRIYNSTIYTEKIRVRENPYYSMFYGVFDPTKGSLRKTISDFDQKLKKAK